MVATDLDGTLLRGDGSVSDRTRAALAAATDAGIALVFVTGRPPRWMRPVADATGHRGVAVCANGALIYDMETEQVVRENPMEPAIAAAVVKGLREALPEAVFAVERDLRFGYEPRFPARQPAPRDALVAEIDELVAGPITKLLVRCQGMDSDTLLARARELLGDLATFTHSSVGGLLEVSGPGVSKALALEQLADEMDVKGDETVAFGDMPNDLPMLAWAGHSVAVSNAHPHVLEAVDEVTASNEEDGVALVIERVVGGGGGQPPLAEE